MNRRKELQLLQKENRRLRNEIKVIQAIRRRYTENCAVYVTNIKFPGK